MPAGTLAKGGKVYLLHFLSITSPISPFFSSPPLTSPPACPLCRFISGAKRIPSGLGSTVSSPVGSMADDETWRPGSEGMSLSCREDKMMICGIVLTQTSSSCHIANRLRYIDRRLAKNGSVIAVVFTQDQSSYQSWQSHISKRS